MDFGEIMALRDGLAALPCDRPVPIDLRPGEAIRLAIKGDTRPYVCTYRGVEASGTRIFARLRIASTMPGYLGGDFSLDHSDIVPGTIRRLFPRVRSWTPGGPGV